MSRVGSSQQNVQPPQPGPAVFSPGQQNGRHEKVVIQESVFFPLPGQLFGQENIGRVGFSGIPAGMIISRIDKNQPALPPPPGRWSAVGKMISGCGRPGGGKRAVLFQVDPAFKGAADKEPGLVFAVIGPEMTSVASAIPGLKNGGSLKVFIGVAPQTFQNFRRRHKA